MNTDKHGYTQIRFKKKNNLRSSAFIIVALLPLFVLPVGCGKKSDSIVLRYSVWGGPYETKIFQEIEADFQKTHPQVQLKMERTPFADYMTKLLTQFSANDAPDVMWVNCNQLPAFA